MITVEKVVKLVVDGTRMMTTLSMSILQLPQVTMMGHCLSWFLRGSAQEVLVQALSMLELL
jgi:hypothetical protein